MATLRSLIVKIGAQDAEIQKALADIGVRSRSLDLDLKKLGQAPLAQGALKSLEVLQQSVKSITDAQQRLADRARLAAQGIDAIGGPARLTKTELDQMNREIQQGLDAFRALGQQAPRDLQRVASAVAQQQQALAGGASSSNLLRTSLGQLTAAFSLGNVIANSVSALSAWTREAVSSAGTIVDLHKSTGLSIATIQRFGFVAEQTSATLENFTDAAFRLGTRIAGGGTSIVKAIEDLGLSFEQVRSLNPDQLFETVVEALGRMANEQERNRLALLLFGPAAAAILPAIAEGYKKLADAAVVSSDEQVKAVDAAAERWERFVADQKANIRSLLGEIVIFGDAFAQALAQTSANPTGDGASIDPRLLLSPRPGGAREDIDLPAGVRADTATYVEKLQQAKAAVAALTAAERTEIAAAQELGRTVAEIRDEFGLSETAQQLFTEARQKDAQAAQAHAQAIANVRTATDQYTAALADVHPLVQDLIVVALKAGVSQADIAKAYGVTVGQVKRLADITQTYDNVQAVNNNTLRGTSDNLKNVGTQVEIVQRKWQDYVTNLEKLQKIAEGPLTLSNQRDLRTIGVPAGPPLSAEDEAFVKRFEEFKRFTADVQGLTNAFAQLAQISGQSFDGPIQDLARLVGSINLATQAMHQLAQASSAAARLAGVVTGVGAVLSIASTLQDVFVTPEFRRVMRDVGRRWGADISEGVAQGIAENERRLRDAFVRARGLTFAQTVGPRANIPAATDFRVEAELLALPDILREIGVEAFGLEQATAAAVDLFAALAKGRLTAQQVGDTFNDVFAQLIPAAIDRTTGLAADAFVRLQQVALASGIRFESLEGFRAEQIESVLKGVETVLKNSMLTSQAAATGLAGAIAASFNELQRQGLSMLEILKQLDPSIKRLAAQLALTGFSGGAAFDQIRRFADIARDTVAGPLLEALAGANSILTGLYNTGLLTQDVFAGVGAQVVATFDKLIARGVDANDALRLMQPTLQTLWELQQRTNLALDEHTQKLLDDAEAAGLIGEQFKSPAERMITALERMNTLLEAMARHFGVTIPEAVGATADAINALPPPPFGFPRPPTEGSTNIDPLFASTGGRITRTGIQHFGGGGRILPFVRGSDTVPIMATPNEWIFTAAQKEGIDAALADRARGSLAPRQPLVVQLVASGRVLSEVVIDDINEGGPALSKFNRLARNAARGAA